MVRLLCVSVQTCAVISHFCFCTNTLQSTTFNNKQHKHICTETGKGRENTATTNLAAAFPACPVADFTNQRDVAT